MSFLDHLDELRIRIIRSLVAIGAGMVIAFFFYDRLARFVLGPTLATLPPGSQLLILRPGEALSFYMDVALIGGTVLAAPFVMYQVWRFVAPAMYAKEKRLVVPFVALATAGTIAGAAFTHYVMFPAMIGFFATFHSPLMKFTPSIEYTFELYKNMMIGMVVVFQMPTLVLFLAKLRLVTAGMLWRHFGHAILVIFIAAAALTPSTDPWNQTAYAAPMIGLYLISIVIAWIAAPRRGRDTSRDGSGALRLVVGAMVLEGARRAPGRRRPSW